MITIKASDGTVYAATGKEAAVAAEAFAKLIVNHDETVKTRRVCESVKKDTAFIRRQYEGDPMTREARVNLKGVKLRQYEFVAAYLRDVDPAAELGWVCRLAIGKVTGEGGYSDFRILRNYCRYHGLAKGR